MSLTLHFHPLASFCWKPLIALYENDMPFTPVIVDLGDEQSRAAFLKISPTGKMPALRDDARDRTVLESTIVVEYLAAHYPGPVELVPADIDLALAVRQADRFYDFYVQEPMQKIVGDRLRPEGQDRSVRRRAGARPAAQFLRHHRRGDAVEELGDGRGLHHGRLRGVSGTVLRQQGRAVRRQIPGREALSRPPACSGPSFARVIEEAQPYFKFFPYNNG